MPKCSCEQCFCAQTAAFFALIVLLFSCSAPERDNPLDPRSDRYTGKTSVEGSVLGFYAPYHPVPGATVSLLPLKWSVSTDEQGRFRFEAVPEGNYRLVAFKKGYAADSLGIDVRVWKRDPVEIHLDALPQLVSVQIHTRHVSRWWPPDDLYFLEIDLFASDGDGLADIQRTAYEFPDYGISDTLRPGDQAGEFICVREQKHLPVGSLQELIGAELYFDLSDRAGKAARFGPFGLTRIVEDLATPDSPKGLETAPAAPTLRWIRSPAKYSFTYVAEVFRDDGGVVTKMWESSPVPSEQDSVKLQTELPLGTYFWTVSVVDRFGNIGRSKEAAFRIE